MPHQRHNRGAKSLETVCSSDWHGPRGRSPWLITTCKEQNCCYHPFWGLNCHYSLHHFLFLYFYLGSSLTAPWSWQGVGVSCQNDYELIKDRGAYSCLLSVEFSLPARWDPWIHDHIHEPTLVMIFTCCVQQYPGCYAMPVVKGSGHLPAHMHVWLSSGS